MRNPSLTLTLVLLLAGAQVASQIAPKPPTTSQAIDAWITNAETHLIAVADAMPEAKYSFAPINGEFHGARTFAQQVKHLAANNYAMATKILGSKPTADQDSEEGPESVKSKAEITSYLQGSFAALHKAVATIDASNEVSPIPGAYAATQNTRLALAVDAVAHSFNHYGQLVEYLRMNGIVPPASR
jgi:uncharacterized damage-inducible protein DinB